MSSNIKFDKETLVKHRFWIALAVFVPLWLVAWLVLWLSVSGAVEAKKKEYDDSQKKIATVTDPKTEHFRNPMTEKKDKLAGRKGVLWKEVWAPQGNLTVDWPISLEGKTPGLAKLVNAPFGAPIKEDDVSERQHFRDFLYKEWKKTKREQFAYYAGPMTLNFDNVIGMAPFDATENEKVTPSMEEIWANQETVWVKRELLWVIRQTLERLADFEPVSPSEKEALPDGVVTRHHLRNRNWELDLLLKPAPQRQFVISKDSTIKNVNAGKRTLPLREVRVWLWQASTTEPGKTTPGPAFTIQGDPVAWGKTASIGQDVRVDNYTFDVKQPIFATQMFTWGTSPIKQIDALELGQYGQSSRTAFQELRRFKEEEPSQAPASSSSSAVGGKAGAMGGAPAASASKTGESSLVSNLKRYIQVNNQLRRIPVGIVLIMDQAYIEDVVSQLVNSSRLRFQPTQVQWQQASGVKQPEADGSKETAGQEVAGKPGAGRAGGKPGAGRGMMPGGGGMPGGGMPGGADMMMMSQGASRGMEGAMRGAGQGPSGAQMMMGMQGQAMGAMTGATGMPGGASSAAAADESDPNLVEFALYGIISLYDRVVEPQAASAPPGAAQTPATTPAQPTTPPDNQPKPGDQTKPDTTPKAGDQPKPDATPKTDDQPKNDAAPKANEKKANDKPVEGEAKKAGENKGS
jgi:hypothetical protein